jgi:hypothetical protein
MEPDESLRLEQPAKKHALTLNADIQGIICFLI